MPSCGHNPLRQTSSNTAFLIGLVALVAAVITAPVSGQPGGVRVDTEWVFESDAAHAGTTIHAALRVKVHENFHVQSNKPDDEFLIPTTLALAPLAPGGRSVLRLFHMEELRPHAFCGPAAR